MCGRFSGFGSDGVFTYECLTFLFFLFVDFLSQLDFLWIICQTTATTRLFFLEVFKEVNSSYYFLFQCQKIVKMTFTKAKSGIDKQLKSKDV